MFYGSEQHNIVGAMEGIKNQPAVESTYSRAGKNGWCDTKPALPHHAINARIVFPARNGEHDARRGTHV
jgi:hypothetical protein